ncbi:hypothetical protein DK926_00635 [Rhodococcus sp. Eu-32]|uniref:type IV toxin-antitoxin system AbiEi family antitoxin domain-containing protein n=1 Tax=Rhodococcus sp. Eu-32 TaxID=1017319 RepID=UPI000DF13FEC|nr:type IV toxin-antitoxin system AbiEi family antitoxin domain-containing protein [Rhodococcus sp. Eu-32]RRQ29423.1 hypothetical protein DK926_00635 [Rhodococcus sp. Eu-32]
MFTRAEALAAGYTDDDLRRGRAARQIIAIRRGYYIRADLYAKMTATEQHSMLARAVYQDSGAQAVLSHVSAAVLHGMDVWKLPLDKVNLTIGRSYASKKGRRRVLHGTAVTPDECTTVDGLRVTKPARTIIDVARSSPLEQSICVGDYALHHRLTTTAELDAALKSALGRTGIGRARRAVGLMSAQSESIGESRSRLLLGDIGISPPLSNQWVYDDNGRFVARVDFLWPEKGVVGEFDGKVKYRSRVAKEVIAEKNRENRLIDLGWTVVRWDWDELEAHQILRARIEAAFGRAARHAAPGGAFYNNRLP